MTDTSKPKPVLIRCTKVLAKTGLAQSSMYEKIKQGEFPRPVRLTDKRPATSGQRKPKSPPSAWIESEVDDWIASRIAARDQEFLTSNASPDKE